MALSAQQKVSIRDHLCVPFAGVPQSTYTAGLRTILTVGQLEMYLNVLQVEEECRLTGYPFGVLRIFGNVSAGQTVTATINGTPVTYDVQASDALSPTPLLAVAGGLANAINISTVGVQSATGSITSGDVAPAALPVFGQVTLTNPTLFTLTAGATGGLNCIVDPSGNGQTYPQPNTALLSGVPALYGYIAICDYMLARIAQADAFLSFDTADVVKFRKYEIEKRTQLYDFWRKKMGVALSVGPNPAGTEGMGSGFGITA
jgi:hypothetical protein